MKIIIVGYQKISAYIRIIDITKTLQWQSSIVISYKEVVGLEECNSRIVRGWTGHNVPRQCKGTNIWAQPYQY